MAVLWFATGSGVLHYNGASWKTYTVSDGLLSNNVTSVAVAPDGTLWVGTGYDGEGTIGGLSHFDGQTWMSTTDDNGLDDSIIAIAFRPRRHAMAGDRDRPAAGRCQRNAAQTLFDF